VVSLQVPVPSGHKLVSTSGTVLNWKSPGFARSLSPTQPSPVTTPTVPVSTPEFPLRREAATRAPGEAPPGELGGADIDPNQGLGNTGLNELCKRLTHGEGSQKEDAAFQLAKHVKFLEPVDRLMMLECGVVQVMCRMLAHGHDQLKVAATVILFGLMALDGDACRIEAMRCGALIYLNEIFKKYEDLCDGVPDSEDEEEKTPRGVTWEDRQLFEAASALMQQLQTGGHQVEKYRKGYYQAIKESQSPSRRRGPSRGGGTSLSPTRSPKRSASGTVTS
jgi:hypothetical protein